MRARAAVLIALTLAALAVGCGSDSAKSDYVTALNDAQTGLTKRFTDLQSRITPTSTPKQDDHTLRDYEAAVSSTVKDLRAVDPPDGLDALHRRFIGQVADWGTALRAARTQLQRGERLAVQGRLATAVQRTGREINATIKAINDKLKG